MAMRMNGKDNAATRARPRAWVAAALVMLLCCAPWPDSGAAPAEIAAFGSNPGNLRMWAYVPEDLPPGAPLVVALHGCGQSAADYDDETGWVQYADRFGFALLLPEQKRGLYFGNHPLGCFNWYYRGDQGRYGGEALSIIQMVDRMIADYGSDPARVYVTGLSAGGAMTAALLAAWPDRIAGGAIIAGVPYRCSSVPDYVPQWAVSYWAFWLGYTDPLRCLKPGVDLSPVQWGDRVRGQNASTDWPVVSIWQGTADRIVVPANAIELAEQWTDVHRLDPGRYTENTVGGHMHRVYHDREGRGVVELFLIGGLGHGTPIDPAVPGGGGITIPDQCGIAGEYVLPAGICASYHIARFWGLVPP